MENGSEKPSKQETIGEFETRLSAMDANEHFRFTHYQLYFRLLSVYFFNESDSKFLITYLQDNYLSTLEG